MQTQLATSDTWRFDQARPSIPTRPVDPPDPDHWPKLWARCWARIRTWETPPRWTIDDWRDEARAHGALAAWEALRDFDPARGVPRSAFLYQKVVAAAWTRYRQEWSFGRRTRPLTPISDRIELGAPHHDPEIIRRLASTLETLPEVDRRLIAQLFWDGRTEDELARTLGMSRQGVNKRKRRLLSKLRSLIGDRGGNSHRVGCLSG